MSHPDATGIHVDTNQALLMKILFSAENETLSYYEKWMAAVPFDLLDGGSFRLMPMLYKKLAPYGLRDERYEKIKGIYRYTLYKNSIILSGFHKIAQALHNTGIRVILLKGGALILKYYPDRGVRPMNDIDILIEKHHVKQALDILDNLGWHDSLDRHFDLAMKMHPALTLISGHGFELDLHWNIMTEYGHNPDASQWWHDECKLDYKGVPIYFLNAEDQIIHNCAHGVKWNALPSIRWIPDVLTILDAEPDLSWTLLALKCHERKLTMPVRSCLLYLKSSFNAPVPDDALNLLFTQQVSDKERKIYDAYTAPLTFAQRVVRQWKLYQKKHPDRSWPVRILFFPGFLKEKSGIVKYSDCLIYLGSLICRNMMPSKNRQTDPSGSFIFSKRTHL